MVKWFPAGAMGGYRAAKSKPRHQTSRASSSGSLGSSKSDTPSPFRERVGSYELAGLVKAWDDNEVVRDMLREDHQLFRTYHEVEGALVAKDAYVEGTVANVQLNFQALQPVIQLMGENDRLLPHLDTLIQCTDALYRKVKKPRSLEHSYQMAWGCRRLIQVVKGCCYKETPPQDCSMAVLLSMCGKLVSILYIAFVASVTHDNVICLYTKKNTALHIMQGVDIQIESCRENPFPVCPLSA